MLLVLFLVGIASASLSEDFNKNPDLYYRILLKLDLIIFVANIQKFHQRNLLLLIHGKILFE